MSQTILTPVADAVNQTLLVLQPEYLQLINESINHAGYFEGKESHFKLTIVTNAFESVRKVARHQQIYQLLDELMTAKGGSIHALAIHAYTPTEWQNVNQAPASPNCAGANL
ncbi:BolA family protein [Psychrobacter sp. HD31]|uniref:BolA family protein n=1 Tax=Psychrobacter sp. HD31 TaxID=3112003 RepID=UPI003DA2FF6A